MTNMLQNHVRTAKTKIMERTLDRSYHVFLRLHYDNDTMDHQACNTLRQWYQTATAIYNTTPEFMIYFRAPPHLAWKRRKSRDRKEERNISEQYVKKIHTLYDEWLIRGNPNTKVIPLNADQTTEDILTDLNDILSKMVLWNADVSFKKKKSEAGASIV